MNFPDYTYEFCPTESSAGGTLLYIRNHLSYKLRKDLSIYKSRELESTLIYISQSKKTNIVIGCTCKHPNMNLDESNEFRLHVLLDKLSK